MHLFESQVKPLIYNALSEDIKGGDITTDAVTLKNDPEILCDVTAKENGVVCGLQIFSMVFDIVSKNNYEINFLVQEGEPVLKSQKVILLKAKASVILYAERTALNFIQHLSGIATIANLARKELEGLKTKVLDTRKTIPGLRLLQKYAVKIGGAENHRFDLSSGILIKDNHIKLAGGVKNALKMVRDYYSGFNFKIEVEASTLDEVKECLEGGADIIMLDNMDVPAMKNAVELINGKSLTEASGNITINKLRKIAQDSGVDYISMGSLTNSITPADFSLNFII
ncbi:MAG: carboxylating nicotinate-nucleotide diphosphorylase [Deltaproteobacteria bacterium]|jgi:nicotinate-nucleotide pyrophosphorylase|nr:carboxylating nicotinate-nucleotide diphosphorylase [Deltaproteobacteria bacterium]MCL5880641.1 carboxylating nicotinate-nucleotide diphosphorylase [Deltaproteobacteria bacterium]MDA8305152.1 carboxylating nicotinate-nucleotide diphosphorylase [Deltaproteobacteria bacterium]